MNEPFAVLRRSEVQPGSHVIVQIGDREVGLFNVAGRLYALPNICFHQQGPVCRGTVSGTVVADERAESRSWGLDGEVLVCPWHFLEFHIPTGRCLNYSRRRLPLYEIEELGELIRVWARPKRSGPKTPSDSQ